MTLLGHVKSRDDDYVGRNVWEMQQPGKIERGRPNMMYLDVLNEVLQEVGPREDEVFARSVGRIPSGYP